MAKGQVSEEELTKGLKGIGNFGGLSPKVQRDNPFRDSRSDKPEPPKTIDVRLPSAPQIAKERVPDAAKPVPKPLRTLTPAPKAKADNLGSEDGVAGIADGFDRVTLPISPDMRDEIEALARDLQRARTTKGERITANTVMRVALQLLMKNYQFERGDVANNESELYDLIVRRFRKK
jgi:hypothetical protein